MNVFFDSSAWAKRYIEEEGSEAVEGICGAANSVALSIICVPEIVSALSRRLREGTISRRGYREAKVTLSADVVDAVILQLVPEVIVNAIRVLELAPVRAMDALHVASALEWRAELFVSADERQLIAAKRCKLRTERV